MKANYIGQNCLYIIKNKTVEDTNGEIRNRKSRQIG